MRFLRIRAMGRTINRFQIMDMKIQPKIDVLYTKDSIGCNLVHKKGDVVRNFFFPFIKKQIKEDIVLIWSQGKCTRKEFNEYFREIHNEEEFQVYGWVEEDGIIYRRPSVLIRMSNRLAYRKICETDEQCREFIDWIKESKEDFLELDVIID